eukprot:TRINITY_DN54156_c0_g1_i1.p1 TRINITY_DN54156_c0_g1~~TRINITY_DN54156_c0_g1_i1.p1  ORF type:complete len:108 (-),score=0.53 TRINITY_DN54156_c0_g1_i1:64-387(-)
MLALHRRVLGVLVPCLSEPFTKPASPSEYGLPPQLIKRWEALTNSEFQVVGHFDSFPILHTKENKYYVANSFSLCVWNNARCWSDLHDKPVHFADVPPPEDPYEEVI